jgi:methylmalonyl-CoA carboxyltransferase 12S subunit
VTLHWTDLALILAIVGSGSTVVYFLLMRTLRLTVLDRQRELENRIAMLAEVMRNVGPPLGEQGPSMESTTSHDAEPELIRAADPADRQERDEVPAEMKVVIAAAAVAALGPNARVVSARAVRPDDAVSPWSQQGRVSVQASHNLRVRR